jgi:uncharacterized protein (TIGR00255 family)
MPDVIKNEKKESDEEEWGQAKITLDKALKAQQDFRRTEGKSLEDEFIKRIGIISHNLILIESIDGKRAETIKVRISKHLSEQVGKENVDSNRFEQELIYYLEKIDITEEKVRLKTHCDYFLITIKEPSGGRKLNFITQEIGREINTIGSKANDAEIQKLVVQMKDELEKMKEQTMNVL